MSCPTNPLGVSLDQCIAKSLPLLPGNTFNFNVGADRFHRPQHWGLSRGVPVLKDRDCPRNKPGIGGKTQPPWAPCHTMPDTSIYPKGQGPKVPSWLAFDKQVLTFEAYFQEPIPESALENYRVHQCRIMFFLEDDTVKVTEPPTYNSGLPQGTIIRRHRIPLPPPCEDHYYTVEHFNVGCEVNLYGKVFFICACDAFTRNFLNRLGIPVPENMELPADQATMKMLDAKMSQFPRKPYLSVDTRGPFLLHDRHVLRFWAYWDDRCNMYGDLRQFVVHYFLSDDTMEVREIIRPNSGYDSFPVFIRRGKVPKENRNLVPLPGEETPLTILNVFGSIHSSACGKARYLVDNLGIGGRDISYYKDSDLAIGAVINVFGRAFTLTDCDEFTKQYYREKYNIQDFTPLVLNEPKPQLPCPEVPPYTGWGTEEDSLVSWNSLELKPFVKDFRKAAAKEKDILRFDAKFYCPLQKVNAARRFTINYYMSDDTMQIFEKEHPNVGLPKGNFLLRCEVKKPGWQPEIGKQPEYYQPGDFYVGAILDINSFKFQLLSADEFTLSYMEANKELFPHADINKCLTKVREAFGPLQAESVLKCFSEKDACLQGVMDVRNFRSLLLEVSKGALSEHEIITLSRAYACHAPLPGTDWQTLQAICQTELRKNNFDKTLLARIEYTFRYHDPCRTGLIDRDTLGATLKGAKVPLFKDLMNYLVANFPTAEGDTCCRVNYCDLLKFLNWEDNPAPVAKPAAIQCVMKWIEPKPPMKILCVNYRAFLEDVCPNFKCALPAVCCCGTSQPCMQHPCQQLGSGDGFCPNPANEAESEMPQCEAQVPIEVHIQPCCMQSIPAQGHKCSPDAYTCNDISGSGQSGAGDCSQNEGQTQFECQIQAPCCS